MSKFIEKYKDLLIIIAYFIFVGILFMLARFLEYRENKINAGIETEVNNSQIVEEVEATVLEEIKPINEEDYVLGDLDAPVKIIAYVDFTCPFCADFYDTIKEIEAEFTDDAVIAVRYYSTFSNQLSAEAFMLADCAGEQGYFWEMSEKLFEANRNKIISLEQISRDAEAIGLDMDCFNQCFEAKNRSDIKSQIKAVESAGVFGTPTIFVNDEILPGAYPMDDFVDSQGVEREGLRKIIQLRINN